MHNNSSLADCDMCALLRTLSVFPSIIAVSNLEDDCSPVPQGCDLDIDIDGDTDADSDTDTDIDADADADTDSDTDTLENAAVALLQITKA